jgi:hypothetical protein
MNDHPAGAGCDGNPRRRLEIAAGVTRLGGLSSYSPSAPVHKAVTADLRRPVSNANSLHSADLASEAAETLRSVRRGGPAPNGEAAVTRDRRDRDRAAGRGGAGRVRFAVGADCCGAAGCRRTDALLVVETAHGRRVLCPLHARRVSV